jgi:2-C-methyl-D-erythritol 4-phosphate cytidylyltransferase/2-C-methyl-D-erythritol 2,4-cyclodiphosphate synthase
MPAWLVLAAGGRGERTGLGYNKVFAPMPPDGACAVLRCLAAFEPFVEGVALVIGRPDISLWKAMASSRPFSKPIRVAFGGSTRQASVAAGLRCVSEGADVVLVHDAARPFVTAPVIERCLASARAFGSGVPSTAIADTVAEITEAGAYGRPLERDRLRAIQTPQAFRHDWLAQAYAAAEASGFQGTDDASLLLAAGRAVRLVEGDPANWKLTTPEDFQRGGQDWVPRVGNGYDAHRLVEGRKLILGGVEVPYKMGLLGHSDADVAAHALIDAMLGAACLGDIGQWFPPTDPGFEGISSLTLLERTAAGLRQEGWRVVHADITLVAQAPKLAPYIGEMRQKIAHAAGLNLHAVSVKATTTEYMGFEGRGEGISALATASVIPHMLSATVP